MSTRTGVLSGSGSSWTTHRRIVAASMIVSMWALASCGEAADPSSESTVATGTSPLPQQTASPTTASTSSMTTLVESTNAGTAGAVSGYEFRGSIYVTGRTATFCGPGVAESYPPGCGTSLLTFDVDDLLDAAPELVDRIEFDGDGPAFYLPDGDAPAARLVLHSRFADFWEDVDSSADVLPGDLIASLDVFPPGESAEGGPTNVYQVSEVAGATPTTVDDLLVLGPQRGALQTRLARAEPGGAYVHFDAEKTPISLTVRTYFPLDQQMMDEVMSATFQMGMVEVSFESWTTPIA